MDKYVELLGGGLSTMHENYFQAKASKCQWRRTQLEFLGHIINAYGISINQTKVYVVREWKQPEDVTYRCFLGFRKCFRRFVSGYSDLSAPLTDILSTKVRWDVLLWTLKRVTAFESMKAAVADSNSEAVQLNYPDFSKSFGFEVMSDASIVWHRGRVALLPLLW